MRFEIETDTLRVVAERGFDGVWRWTVTRANIDEDAVVLLVLHRGEASCRLAEAVQKVLADLAATSARLARDLKLETEAT